MMSPSFFRFTSSFTVLSLMLVGGCMLFSGGDAMSMSEADPHLWLEEIEGEKALAWVRNLNERSVSNLESRPDYKVIESETRKILLAKDRTPTGAPAGGFIYNFWQGENNVRGLWRRTSLAEYSKAEPKWETLLDLDKLAGAENENWVWQGAQCLPPQNDRCIIKLSRGGSDASVNREFDIATRSFVKGGFELPAAKSWIDWYDRDTLFVATDFGPGTLTSSGYPREVRVWRRGEPLTNAKSIINAEPDHMYVSGWTAFSPGSTYRFVSLSKTFWEMTHFLVPPDNSLVPLPLPPDADLSMVFGDYALVILRNDWAVKAQKLKAGSLIALDLKNLAEEPELVFTPDDKASLRDGTVTRNAVYLSLLENVNGRLMRLTKERDGWRMRPVDLPANGSVWLHGADPFDEIFVASYENYLTPSTVYIGRDQGEGTLLERARQSPLRFDATGLTVEQLEAKSADGTKIPYFIIAPKNLKHDGSTPTILYGYGGFETALTPYYLGPTGKVWSEAGGIWVVANIRGGGEFGPKWHQAALKENRQRAFDDFIAVAEDLVKRGITSPAKLAIMGGSNGGLLVGATFTQRPELFRAVVCQVPLLDMLRYHKLLAGHSWIAEYGSPDIPSEAESIRRYSPYQNLRSGVKYPKVFFMTSTKDDRVHPGHARKMAARMEELGHEFEYYENIEGGHGAAANLEQRIRFNSLMFAFLRRELAVDSPIRTDSRR